VLAGALVVLRASGDPAPIGLGLPGDAAGVGWNDGQLTGRRVGFLYAACAALAYPTCRELPFPLVSGDRGVLGTKTL
jgi:hypothetical protein